MPWILSGADLGAEVLEVGPGPGLTSDFLCARVPRLTAIEADPKLAESLRLRMSGSNVSVVTGDAASMPFQDAVFSGCATFTMLHHVPSPELQDAVFREMKRVLRPGANWQAAIVCPARSCGSFIFATRLFRSTRTLSPDAWKQPGSR